MVPKTVAITVIGGEVPYGDGGGRDGIANPGRHKDGDFALETITAAVVEFSDYGDSGGDVLTAMEVVTAVAVTPDLTGTESYGSEDCGNYGDSGCESSYSDSDGLGNGAIIWTQRGWRFRVGGDNGMMLPNTVVITATARKDGNISNGDGDGRDATRATAVVAPTAMIQDAMGAAMSTRRRYTSGVIGTMVTDAAAIRSGGAEDCSDYGESFYSDRGGRGGSDYQDSMRAAKSPKRR
ncbi:hypothetical protein Bbelb_021150 [Branchiostoma belcheri]|nr:hypothetical protein Bbelb_021150 [Branchiostoma belcheri]